MDDRRRCDRIHVLMPGGRERTAEEFASLFDCAAFELTRIVPTEPPLIIVEAVVR